MTLNGVMAVILRYSTEFGSFGANYAKLVKDRPIFCNKNSKNPNPKNLAFNSIIIMIAIFAEISENEFVREKHPLSKAII